MKPHRILSAFKHAGQLIEPPGMWTPPSVGVAERLVAAKCLRAPGSGDLKIELQGEVFTKQSVTEIVDRIDEQVGDPDPEPPKAPAKKSRRRSRK